MRSGIDSERWLLTVGRFVSSVIEIYLVKEDIVGLAGFVAPSWDLLCHFGNCG